MKVLLCDHEPGAEAALVAACGRCGHEVVADPRDAVDLAIIEPGPVPSVDTARSLTRLQPRPQIVVLTAYPSIAGAIALTRAGVDRYLPQPVADDQLFGGSTTELAPPTRPELPSLARVEWEYISYVLARNGGNISRSARVLGIHRQCLQRKLRKYAPRW